jgi:hypothetical protein
MLSAILFWLSPTRRRFIKQTATPALAPIRQRLERLGSPSAQSFISTLLDANAEFMAFSLSRGGALADATPTKDMAQACFRSLLVYSVNLFARQQMADEKGDLVTLLSQILDVEVTQVLLRRDALRKNPRSEEWMVYTWLRKDLGLPASDYDAAAERSFGYQYLSYIAQYKTILESTADSASTV